MGWQQPADRRTPIRQLTTANPTTTAPQTALPVPVPMLAPREPFVSRSKQNWPDPMGQWWRAEWRQQHSFARILHSLAFYPKMEAPANKKWTPKKPKWRENPKNPKIRTKFRSFPNSLLITQPNWRISQFVDFGLWISAFFVKIRKILKNHKNSNFLPFLQ